VTVAVRDPAAAAALIERARREAWAGQVRACRLDLADLATVRDLARSWEGPLHALVANAGIMALPHLVRSPEGWEMQLATNHLGHFALATGLYGNLKASGSARLVVVSSGAHRDVPFDFDDPQF
jgi:NAD(P)-dependent dehydrogenase (short-subunit alcohol dehydrogenase family)